MSDLYKLALSDGQQRYLLYVADPKMAAHCERQMETIVQTTSDQPACLASRWLGKQPKTLKSTVRGGLGFLPESLEPIVWVEASWVGASLTIWLLGVAA